MPIALDVGSLADGERRPFLLRLGPSDCDQYVTQVRGPASCSASSPASRLCDPATSEKRAELALPRRLDDHVNSRFVCQSGELYLA